MVRFCRTRPLSTVAAVIALSATTLGGCSGGSSTANNSQSDAVASPNPLSAIEPASLMPSGIFEKGTKGEQPVATVPKLTPAEEAKVRAGHFKVGVVMHTLTLDWSTLEVRGIEDTLKKYGVQVIGVTDAHFKAEDQVSDIQNMIQRHPDGIISIPVDQAATASAYKKIGQAGIKLVLIMQVPQGLKYPSDYQAMIGPSDVQNGMAAAKILSYYIPQKGTAGVIGYGVDFFTTNQRELGFKSWMKENRPDVTVKSTSFLVPTNAGSVGSNFLTANPDISGLEVSWDAPALAVAAAERQSGKTIPITTTDLGNQAAVEIATGGLVKGVAAQAPYDMGATQAIAMMKVLLGEKVAPWTVVPGWPAVQKNVVDVYQKVWHESPPPALVNACKSTPGCQSAQSS